MQCLRKFVSCIPNTLSYLVKEFTYSEARLLQLLAEGDAAAFRVIYDRFQQPVFSFAFYLTKSKDLSEEVVQEVFTRVWEKRESLPEELSLLPYIKKMTQNLVLDIFRKAGREQAFQQVLYNAMSTVLTEPSDALHEKELRRIYRDAIDLLPPQKKIIFTLSRDHQLSYDQIAEKLNLSPNTVRNHMSEAIRSVRTHVEKHSTIVAAAAILDLYSRNPH